MPEGDDKPKPDHSQQYLANERTFLAWVRTCVALIGLGFIVAKFSFFITEFRLIIQRYLVGSAELPINKSRSLEQNSSFLGIGIVVLSVILILFTLKNYSDNDKAIKAELYEPKHIIIYITTATIVALTVVIVAYLLYISNS